MFHFIYRQCKGKAALGDTKLTVDLEPHLCSGVIYRRFQPADGGQLKFRDVRIQNDVPVIIGRAIYAYLYVGYAKFLGLQRGNPRRHKPQKHTCSKQQAYQVSNIPLFFASYQHPQILLTGEVVILIPF